MLKWAMVLHFYQPPVQDLGITKEVAESCYKPLLRLIKNNPHVRMTVNISGCLLEQMGKMHQHEFFELLKQVIDNGQLEVLSTPAYHPIIPLSPLKLIERQIDKNEKIYSEVLGFNPGRGLFAPELAVDENTLDWIRDKYEYVICDETSVNERVDLQTIYPTAAHSFNGVKIVVNSRSLCDIVRSLSDRILAEKVMDYVLSKTSDGQTVVSVNDAEVFGHHYEERLKLLEDLFQRRDVEWIKAGEIQAAQPAQFFQASSWQVWPGENDEKAFGLWTHKNNQLQQTYWDLMQLAVRFVENSRKYMNQEQQTEAEYCLDRGYSSCYLYWLSNWPWWHPGLVGKGAEQLILAIRASAAASEEKIVAEQLYHKFLNEMWSYHWSGVTGKRYQEFDTRRAKWMEDLPKINKE